MCYKMDVEYLMLFNKKLIHLINEDALPLGLAKGKMGICIYLYSIGRELNDKRIQIAAEELMDNIYANIYKIDSIDLQSGLKGIGLGISYLVDNNYVCGDLNVVLSDVDNLIFKKLDQESTKEKIDFLSTINTLFYYTIRLQKQAPKSDAEYLYRGIIRQELSKLFININSTFFNDPLVYSIDYLVPRFLYVLYCIYTCNFYNNIIEKIIKTILPKVLSVIPISQANRLYLLWGLIKVSKFISDDNLNKHIKLLNREIDLGVMLNEEIGDKRVSFSTGLASIARILVDLNGCIEFEEFNFYKHTIIDKMKNSSLWEEIIKNDFIFRDKCGLIDGVAGSIMFLNDYNNE